MGPKTNVSVVYDGLIETYKPTDFAMQTNKENPACFKTLAGDMLYNMYVKLDKLLLDPTMTVPTEYDLKDLESYYEETFKAGPSEAEGKKAMRDRVDAIKNDLGVKLAGIFVIGTTQAQVHPDFEGWWAHDKSAALQIVDMDSGMHGVSVQPIEEQGPTLGLSVRLIQKPTAA